MKRRKFLSTLITGALSTTSLAKWATVPLISRDQLAWGGITSPEISHGTIMTDAAQISNSVIRDAHIRDLSVVTLNLPVSKDTGFSEVTDDDRSDRDQCTRFN